MLNSEEITVQILKQRVQVLFCCQNTLQTHSGMFA